MWAAAQRVLWPKQAINPQPQTFAIWALAVALGEPATRRLLAPKRANNLAAADLRHALIAAPEAVTAKRDVCA